jgi:O-antigen ligase
VSLYFIGVDLFSNDKKFTALAFKIYLLVTFVVAVLGFFQIIIIPDFAQLAAEGGWDPHQYRLLSTFFDPNFVGGFFVVGLNFVLAALLFKTKLKERPALVLFAVTLTLAILLTLSRSSYLALFLSIFIFASLRSRKLFLGISGFLLVLFLLLPPVQVRLIQTVGFDDSARARVVSWQNALQIARDNPILGVGFNSYRFTQDRYGFFIVDPTGGHSGSGADSSLLLILATTGIVGLASYLSILWGFFKEAYSKRNTVYGLAFLVSIGALLIHSQFVNSLLYPQIMEIFWFTAALTVANKKER